MLAKNQMSGTPFCPGEALHAEPTYTHHVLTALYEHGSLASWVQQNHDGLPQKAGLPQRAICEIHGAWFDPSNPVVPMTGSLRTDLVKQMREMMLTQWRAGGNICENFSPRKNRVGCTGLPFYHWGALTGFLSLLEKDRY